MKLANFTREHADVLAGGPAIVANAAVSNAALDDLSDVNAPSPADGDVLTWDDGASEWIAAAGATAEAPVQHGNMGATETLDRAAGGDHRGTLTADCTITVTGFTVDEYADMAVGIAQDGTGGWAVTWDADVVWSGDDQPAQGASEVTWYVLWSDEGDSVIYGAKVGGGGTAGTPALTLSTTNATGAASTFVATDATVAVFDATVPT